MATYQFTRDGNTVTVTSNDRIKSAIENDDNVEKTLIELLFGHITTHSFGKTCEGDWDGATAYVHVSGTSNRDLLAYSSNASSGTTGSVTVKATGFSKDGKHKFNTKGKF